MKGIDGMDGTSAVTLFETMRVRHGRLPLLDRHLGRLRRATATVGLPDPPDTLGAEAAVRAQIGRDRVLRLAWSAAGTRWSGRRIEGPPAWRVATVDEPHPGYPVKSDDRAAFDRALAAARRAGADEPLLATPTGTVVEGARFAVVWVEGDELCYADPELGGLPSVGLARLLQVAVDAGVATRAAWAAVSGLRGASIGLVNAVRGLVKVETLDGDRVSGSKLLERLAAEFWPA